MKRTKALLIIIFFFLLNNAFSQKSNIWLTYGQSIFMYSPGIEANYFFNKHIGLQLGVSSYFQLYEKQQIVNVSDDYLFNFYNANINISTYILDNNNHKIGFAVGFKAYYGPEYIAIYYYKLGGYHIYSDSSGFRPDYGVDFGLFYNFKKLSAILKFDTARRQYRIGIGYSFGDF